MRNLNFYESNDETETKVIRLYFDRKKIKKIIKKPYYDISTIILFIIHIMSYGHVVYT